MKKGIIELYIFSLLNGCVDQLVPTSYKIYESLLGLTPQSLGMISFISKFTQGIFTLLNGYICDIEMGKSVKSDTLEDSYLWWHRLIMISSFMFCILLLGLSFVGNILEIVIILFFMGIFLSLRGPLIQSVVGSLGNLYRGKEFGRLFMFQNIGRVVCIMYMSKVGAGTHMYKFLLIGFSLIFLVYGLFLFFMMTGIKSLNKIFYHNDKKKMSYTNLKAEEKNTNITDIESVSGNIINRSTSRPDSPLSVVSKSQLSFNDDLSEQDNESKSYFFEYRYILKNKSAWLMLIMGVVNGIPRHSLNFTLMWLQYSGLSQQQSSFVYSASWISAIIISPLVGLIGDYSEKISSDNGRQIMASIAIAIRIVLMIIMLNFIPWGNEYYYYYLITSILIGFMAGWPGVGANRPILCEIIKKNHRATFFAIFTLLENVASALLGAPLVGILAESVFNYKSNPNNTNVQFMKTNAKALSNAMLCMTIGPWSIAIILFLILNITFHKDKNMIKIIS